VQAIDARGYFNSPEILAWHKADTTVTPKRRTSGAKSEGRFRKQDFAYFPDCCLAGERCLMDVEAGLNILFVLRLRTATIHVKRRVA
jgi:hypothetical protein